MEGLHFLDSRAQPNTGASVRSRQYNIPDQGHPITGASLQTCARTGNVIRAGAEAFLYEDSPF